ncbi:ribonuclease H-like domain-containing protein [Thelephora terrestris]|uniref:Ribonuclease H-like domain-containing protein n=1 Tax=Thelephora terrestris TaxID=56493 RepID=A0A9P6HHG6_9AGAM|nr:ribonuclease H-like domain-containing protein [Thelephora terrestris]
MSSRYIALSTQSVGVGPAGSTSMLARVVIVGYRGTTLMNEFVKPTLPISDYRTNVTGIVPGILESDDAVPFDEIQARVAMHIADKIIIGHSLWNDLSVIGLPHRAVDTRDVALYRPFRETLRMNQLVGLPTLMWHFMNREIQKERVDPLENARALMDLYRSAETDFEGPISGGEWPFHLPPENFARCYL